MHADYSMMKNEDGKWRAAGFDNHGFYPPILLQGVHTVLANCLVTKLPLLTH